MAYLADTNLLLRGAEQGHPIQEEALQAIAILVRRAEVVHLVPQNLFEFWAVATRPKERNGLGMTAADADAELTRLEMQFPVLPDSAGIYQEWRRLVSAYGIVGVRAHDVRLVAAMVVHDLTHILTFNGDDFRSFREITVVHPREVSGRPGG